MTLRTLLNRLIRVVIEEAERNPDFAAELTSALEGPPKSTLSRKTKTGDVERPVNLDGSKRSKHRRAPALLDPVLVVREGETSLRDALCKLSLDELRDIVAEYGMDTGRFVMKWVVPERVIDRIVEMSLTRAHKGDAFRKPVDASPKLTLDLEEDHGPSDDGSSIAPSAD